MSDKEIKEYIENNKAEIETIMSKWMDAGFFSGAKWMQEAVEKRVEKQVKELKEYPINHKDKCKKWEGIVLVINRKCTCGLDELLVGKLTDEWSNIKAEIVPGSPGSPGFEEE